MTKVVGQLKYNSSSTLGKGFFSSVYSGFYSLSKSHSLELYEPVAIKRLEKGRVKEDEAKKEVDLMKIAGDHANILKYVCFEMDADFL